MNQLYQSDIPRPTRAYGVVVGLDMIPSTVDPSTYRGVIFRYYDKPDIIVCSLYIENPEPNDVYIAMRRDILFSMTKQQKIVRDAFEHDERIEIITTKFFDNWVLYFSAHPLGITNNPHLS